MRSMRESTLQTLGLGTVLEIFRKGKLPVNAGDLAGQIFDTSAGRGSLVISGASGIVGAGKAMQLGSRLLPFNVPIVALDMAGAPNGIGKQYQGLARAFGRGQAEKIMGNIIQLSYDGVHLPAHLQNYRPRFLLEAIPEILSLKKSHYAVFRAAFPDIAIRSVTSGFPSSELGVGIAHPAFPHEVNKVWEIVEEKTSPGTQLFWALGMIPIPVSDNWSFVLDVLFCGLTLAGLKYHQSSNMPFWKIDKYIRRSLGPNPFRAHDAIGAQGANFLTWSCLHHLSEHYGPLFAPTADLSSAKAGGQNWYPLNHFRPLVNWTLDAGEEEEMNSWILGAMCQMTSLLLHEKRAHLSHINIIGELCAQFRRGILAVIRGLGRDNAMRLAERYHRLEPKAAKSAWYPQAFDAIETPEWQQLYVNAEHDGKVGVISLGRESYNSDVDAELNRAIDWLKKEGIESVIVAGDFHLTTQLVGADTAEFFPALDNVEKGAAISRGWSGTARRLHAEFRTSVAFIHGKRCLGGMLELLLHCHYLVAVDSSELGFPEVTLPVVPGMEGCHWSFRKTTAGNYPRILQMLLTGKPVKAPDAVGWLLDYAGGTEDALGTAWKIATGTAAIPLRKLEEGPIPGVPSEVPGLVADSPATEAARRAIVESVQTSCGVSLPQALSVQTKVSADFMASSHCRKGRLGTDLTKKMTV